MLNLSSKQAAAFGIYFGKLSGKWNLSGSSKKTVSLQANNVFSLSMPIHVIKDEFLTGHNYQQLNSKYIDRVRNVLTLNNRIKIIGINFIPFTRKIFSAPFRHTIMYIRIPQGVYYSNNFTAKITKKSEFIVEAKYNFVEEIQDDPSENIGDFFDQNGELQEGYDTNIPEFIELKVEGETKYYKTDEQEENLEEILNDLYKISNADNEGIVEAVKKNIKMGNIEFKYKYEVDNAVYYEGESVIPMAFGYRGLLFRVKVRGLGFRPLRSLLYGIQSIFKSKYHDHKTLEYIENI